MSFNSLGSLALGVFLVSTSVVYFQLRPKPIPDVPHNPVTSFWGDIPDLARFRQGNKRTFSEYLASCVDKHGPLFQLLIGNHRLVVVADRLEVERIALKGKNTEQSKRINKMFAIAVPASQIALPTNETWKRHRRLTGPSMSQRYLQRMSTRISTGANNLVRLWAKKVELVGDTPFDADMDLQLVTTDTIVDITMGVSAGCITSAFNSLTDQASKTKLTHIPRSESPPLHLALRTITSAIEQVSRAISPSLTARLFIWPTPTWRKHYGVISGFCNQEIARARTRASNASGEELATDADCVLDMVIQREAVVGAEKFEKGELLDELLTYILGGEDTTAATLAWLVKYLSLDFEIQKKLHEEVCTVFGPDLDGEKVLDFDAVNDSDRVPILEAVVAETSRCAGVGPQVSRELIEDEVILGRLIPKGTQLMLPTVLISKQESDWGPDAKVWRPSRWLRPDGSFDHAAGPKFAFGIGQRSCFGQRLAVLQLKIFVASLSRAFMFKSVPEEIGSWDAVEIISRQPKLCFVSLERWP